ncbi:uncharacterized protein LOC126868409 [Bombus huntii]|uniref:uncharacterized protein LOC126868409 n=1 Tax=Bombus huntii TaxID=85661 RepID=UPI0021AA8B73|nr:uncharacterized protein LOC126868409 [Bombus huntii]
MICRQLIRIQRIKMKQRRLKVNLRTTFIVKMKNPRFLKKKQCCTKKLSGYRCNFCNRMFSYKRHVQSHLFHAHGNAILSDESKITKTSPESLGKSNHGIVMTESNTSHSPCPKNVNSSINISLKLSNGSNNTPTKGSSSNIKSTHSKWLNDSHGTPSKGMKQSVLTDFISPYKDKPNDKWVSPEKVIDTENIPVTATIIPISTLETFSNKTSTAAEVIQMSTSVKRIESPVRKRSSVQTHVNLKTIISLFRNQIKTESESSNTSHNMSYNLRPVKRCSLYDSRDLLECKECVVRLEKCDKFLEPTSFVSNEDEDEDEDAFKQAVSKSVKEEFEGFRETSSTCDLPLKTDTIASKRFNEFVKSFADRLIVPQQESVEFQNFKVCQQKIIQCHICKKSFSSKENLREHMKLFHTIYISSICNARYTSMNKLLTHYLRQHGVFKRRECCVCYEKFDTSALLKRHMILHCLKTIRSKKDAPPVDVEINCNAFKKQHKCKGCRKRFWLYSCLKQHENVCRRMKVLRNKQRVPRVNHSSRPLKEPSDMELSITSKPTMENIPPIKTIYKQDQYYIYKTTDTSKTSQPTNQGQDCSATIEVDMELNKTSKPTMKKITTIKIINKEDQYYIYKTTDTSKTSQQTNQGQDCSATIEVDMETNKDTTHQDVSWKVASYNKKRKITGNLDTEKQRWLQELPLRNTFSSLTEELDDDPTSNTTTQ